MDLFDYLETLIELLIVAYFLFMRARKALGQGDNEDETAQNAEEKPGLLSALLDVDDPSTQDPPTLQLEPLMEGKRVAAHLLKMIRLTEPGPPFIEAQRTLIKDSLHDFSERAQSIHETLSTGLELLQRSEPPLEDPEKHHLDDALRQTLGDLQKLESEFSALSMVLNSHVESNDSPVLEHALNLAESMKLAYPDHPDLDAFICLPLSSTQSQIIVDSLAPKAVIFAPEEADSEPLKWGLIVQSIALSLVRSIPNIEPATTPPAPPWLPRLQGQQVYVDFESHVHHWGAHLAADTLSVMLLGPAAVEALLLEQTMMGSGPGSDELNTDDDTRLVGLEPPMILRGQLALHVLATQGFVREAHSLEARWREETGHINGILSPSLFEKPVRLPLSAYLDEAVALVDDAIYPVLKEAFAPDQGERSALMTPSTWFQIELWSRNLLKKEPFDPQTKLNAVAVAINAAVQAPGASNGIIRWLLGYLAPLEQMSLNQIHRHHERHPETNLTALRQAFILREVLQRPHRRSRAALRRPGKRRGRA